MAHIAYLSLGSNLGQREEQLRAAIARLRTVGKVISSSSFYETEPVEFTEQPWFLNCVVALETSETPEGLLGQILAIEREMGRRRDQEQRKGPRTVDIDILLFDDEIVESTDLIVPHTGMHQRRFVLEPLAEIAPEVRHPRLNKTARELLQDLPAGQAVRRLARDQKT